MERVDFLRPSTQKWADRRLWAGFFGTSAASFWMGVLCANRSHLFRKMVEKEELALLDRVDYGGRLMTGSQAAQLLARELSMANRKISIHMAFTTLVAGVSLTAFVSSRLTPTQMLSKKNSPHLVRIDE